MSYKTHVNKKNEIATCNATIKACPLGSKNELMTFVKDSDISMINELKLELENGDSFNDNPEKLKAKEKKYKEVIRDAKKRTLVFDWIDNQPKITEFNKDQNEIYVKTVNGFEYNIETGSSDHITISKDNKKLYTLVQGESSYYSYGQGLFKDVKTPEEFEETFSKIINMYKHMMKQTNGFKFTY